MLILFVDKLPPEPTLVAPARQLAQRVAGGQAHVLP
jgi:hypothetical protein